MYHLDLQFWVDKRYFKSIEVWVVTLANMMDPMLDLTLESYPQ